MFNHLFWRINFDQPISFDQIHGMETANLFEMDNMLKIPTHNDIHLRNACRSHMRGVTDGRLTQYSRLNIGIAQAAISSAASMISTNSGGNRVKTSRTSAG